MFVTYYKSSRFHGWSHFDAFHWMTIKKQLDLLSSQMWFSLFFSLSPLISFNDRYIPMCGDLNCCQTLFLLHRAKLSEKGRMQNDKLRNKTVPKRRHGQKKRRNRDCLFSNFIYLRGRKGRKKSTENRRSFWKIKLNFVNRCHGGVCERIQIVVARITLFTFPISIFEFELWILQPWLDFLGSECEWIPKNVRRMLYGHKERLYSYVM